MIRKYGQTIRTTLEHPFYVVEAGKWLPAMALEIGWYVLGLHGEELLVTRLQDTGNDDVVYNMRVEDWHTYFVRENGWGFGVWSHNAICAEDGTPKKPLSEMSPDELKEFTTERAEQIRAARSRGHEYGNETWDVAIIETTAGNPSSRIVVITTNLPYVNATRGLLARGEEFRTPELGTIGARDSVRTPPPLDLIGNAHHAEPRMEFVTRAGEQLLFHAPTRGMCDLCRQTVNLARIPETHQSRESYNNYRAEGIESGTIRKPSFRWDRWLKTMKGLQAAMGDPGSYEKFLLLGKLSNQS